MEKMVGSYTRWGLAAEMLSWGLLALIVAIAAVTPTACTSGGDDTGIPPEDGDIGQLLSDVGPFTIIPTLERFRQSVVTLRASLEDWKSAASSGTGVEDAKVNAQQAFVATMSVWQEVEVHQIGPTLDLRDEIYSFPTTNPCRMDQETAEENWGDATFFADNNVNSYGLDGLEYLLFAGPDNDCPNQVSPNKDDAWDTLGPDGVELNRATFAIALVDGVDEQAEAMIDAWAADGGNFSSNLSNAGDGAPFETQLKGLNAVFDALFYLEVSTKDRKLALPLGLRDCDGEDCAYEVEGFQSGASIAYIHANLEGFWALFTNGDEYGMDQLLIDLGHGDLATAFETACTNALAVTASQDGRLDELILNDRAAAEELHTALKALTDLIKVDLTTVLSLEIPKEAAGDND